MVFNWSVIDGAFELPKFGCYAILRIVERITYRSIRQPEEHYAVMKSLTYLSALLVLKQPRIERNNICPGGTA
jgi:hypothetical protein